MTDQPLLAASITFEPTELQVRQTVRNLLACSARSAVLDNSESLEVRQLVKRSCRQANVTYLTTGTNCGTAAGLNKLVDHAMALDLPWLLYFDQDSSFGVDFTDAARSAAEYARMNPSVAAIGSSICAVGSDGADSSDSPDDLRFHPATYVIASGTLIRVAAIKAVGGFDEDLFLDTVDHECCLRLKVLGWHVLRDGARRLEHDVGTDSRAVPGGQLPRVTRHPMWRRQLMWRNSIIICRRYFRWFPLAMLKHLALRTADTLLCAVIYRDIGYVRGALQGIRAGMSSEAAAVAAKYSVLLQDGRSYHTRRV